MNGTEACGLSQRTPSAAFLVEHFILSPPPPDILPVCERLNESRSPASDVCRAEKKVSQVPGVPGGRRSTRRGPPPVCPGLGAVVHGGRDTAFHTSPRALNEHRTLPCVHAPSLLSL